MLTHRKHKLRSRHVVAVALACATALTLLVVGETLARPADVSSNSIVPWSEICIPSRCEIVILKSARRITV